MDKSSNFNKSGGKVRKNKLSDINLPNDLNMNLFNNLNQTNGNLPPDLFNSLSSFTNLNQLNLNHLNNSNNFNNANHLDPNLLLNNEINKNAITSELFTSQSSMLYPNLSTFYQQQQSKLTLSSTNLIPPTTTSSSSLTFHPYLAAIQNSLLNQNFLQNSFFHQPHLNSHASPHLNNSTTNQLMMQNLSNLSSLGSLSNSFSNGLSNSLNNLNSLSFKDYLNQKIELNSLNSSFSTDQLNHLNQINKNLTMLNESFLSNNLNYQNSNHQLNDDFNFSLNTPIKNEQQTIPSPINQPFKHAKRQKLDTSSMHMKNKLQLNDDNKFNQDQFKKDYEEVMKEDLKSKLTECKAKFKEFEELKVQTNEHIKLEEKKFSPDSSTEFSNLINKKKSPIHHHLNINNQSPIVTSTKSSSSNNSTPDIPLNSSLNTLNSLNSINSMNKELLIKVEEEEEELNNDLKIDESFNKSIKDEEEYENENEEHLNEHEQHKTETEVLYNLISKKSFQPTLPTNLKDVSLDRMSFDEDEEDEDNNSININFGSLIDNELRDSDLKDDESVNGCRKSRRSKKLKDNFSSKNPWSIRRSERIFLNEVLNTNSNNTFNLDKDNKDFKLTLKDLDEPKRILIQIDELLVGGLATRDELSGKFCISLDDVECSKNNQAFTFDELIKNTLVEVKVKSIDQLYDGCRVCAVWSSKNKYLYPGKVIKPISSGSSSLLSNSLNNSLNGKKEFVIVHFDDGDKTKIPLEDLRLLPEDFELKSVDVDEESKKQFSTSDDQNDKKVQKLTIKLTNNQLIKKKKKSHHSKEKHKHRHRHKSHNESEELDCVDTELNDTINYQNESDSDVSSDERDKWYEKLNEQSNRSSKSSTKKGSKSSGNKVTSFLPEKQSMWNKWYGNYVRKTSKASKSKKIFYNSIIRDQEEIKINDCAVFLSVGKPNLPYIGRIVLMWQNAQGNIILRIKWFYHLEELQVKSKPKLVDCKVSNK